MSNANEAVTSERILSEIFNSRNGVTIAGIAAITLIVVMDNIIKNQYKLGGNRAGGSLYFEPVVSQDSVETSEEVKIEQSDC